MKTITALLLIISVGDLVTQAILLSWWGALSLVYFTLAAAAFEIEWFGGVGANHNHRPEQ